MDTFVYTIGVTGHEGRQVRYFVVARDGARETFVTREDGEVHVWAGISTSLGLEEVLGIHLPYQLASAVSSGRGAFVADLFVDGERYALYASLDAEQEQVTYTVDTAWKRNRNEPRFESLVDVVRGVFALQRDWAKTRQFLQRLAVSSDALKESLLIAEKRDSASAES